MMLFWLGKWSRIGLSLAYILTIKIPWLALRKWRFKAIEGRNRNTTKGICKHLKLFLRISFLLDCNGWFDYACQLKENFFYHLSTFEQENLYKSFSKVLNQIAHEIVSLRSCIQHWRCGGHQRWKSVNCINEVFGEQRTQTQWMQSVIK